MAFTAKPIRIGRIPGGGQENVVALPYEAAETFLLGAVLTVTSNELVQMSDDPTADIAGIALQGAGTNPGQDAANSPVVITGVFVGVSMALADTVTQYVSDITDGTTSDVATVPTAADIGTTIGLILRADGTWAADRDATGTVITILDIDVDNNSVIWKFTAAAPQL